MMRALWLAAVVLGWLVGRVDGAPGPEQRVVLADADRELRHAIEQSLAPWRLELVVDTSPVTATSQAAQRADAGRARFVVWREGAHLVVYDRDAGTTERRASRAGVLDPLAAAAAALTIKMMMRLPPPPPPLADDAFATSAAPARGFELRAQAGIAMRIARGDRTDLSARLGGAFAIRPWRASMWRFGLAGDGGSSTSVVRAAFRGTWRDWGLAAIASWTYTRGAWDVEPYAGAGVRYSVLSGTEMSTARRETATLAIGRAGLAARWRVASWTFGMALAIDGNLSGGRTFRKTATPATIFQVPGAAVELSGLLAYDI